MPRDDRRVSLVRRSIGDRRALLAPLRSRCRLYRSAASPSPHSGTPRAVPPDPWSTATAVGRALSAIPTAAIVTAVTESSQARSTVLSSSLICRRRTVVRFFSSLFFIFFSPVFLSYSEHPSHARFRVHQVLSHRHYGPCRVIRVHTANDRQSTGCVFSCAPTAVQRRLRRRHNPHFSVECTRLS